CCVILVSSHDFYRLIPGKLGCEVHGIDIGIPQPETVIALIKKDVTEHRILIFKNQHNISPDKHVEISRWFGELESSTISRHAKSPSDDILRVSNDAKEGLYNVGRKGWHIDGSFFPKPYSHALYQMVHVPMDGDTVFVSLNDIVKGLSEEQLARFERLSVITTRPNIIHPLIYSHPETNEKVLCIHMGFSQGFVWDKGTAQERNASKSENNDIKNELNRQYMRDNKKIQYSHKWEVGDFIITDNLAVGHEAALSSQFPRSKVGLRVLHRVTVAGKTVPTKKYDLPQMQKKDEL
ncbi:alpha-ketoglutarate-dependent taurine dioxygenase-like, partial [Saccoglossus kowalevskii]